MTTLPEHLPVIVATFPMSEAYEADLLLLKLTLESPVVSEWVIVENSYSFQGSHLGLFAQELIDTDERFEPYRERVKVISANRAVRSFPPGYDADLAAFQVERWQRDLAMDHVSELDPETWILVCDVDEMLDGTDPARVAELVSRLADETGVVQVSTQRYWYDFDNRFVPLYGIPLVRRSFLVSGEHTLSKVRRAYSGPLRSNWDQTIAFEYTSCFSEAEIVRKMHTQSHTGYSVEDLRVAFRCNHRAVARSRGAQIRNHVDDLLVRVELTPENSPEYVRNNLASLRTGNIADDYLAQRLMEYPRMGSRVRRGWLKNILELLRKKAVYMVRRLGFPNFGLFPEDVGPSPWLDQ